MTRRAHPAATWLNMALNIVYSYDKVRPGLKSEKSCFDESTPGDRSLDSTQRPVEMLLPGGEDERVVVALVESTSCRKKVKQSEL